MSPVTGFGTLAVPRNLGSITGSTRPTEPSLGASKCRTEIAAVAKRLTGPRIRGRLEHMNIGPRSIEGTNLAGSWPELGSFVFMVHWPAEP